MSSIEKIAEALRTIPKVDMHGEPFYLTQTGPELVDAGSPLKPVPGVRAYALSYVGYWVWIVAGEICASAFEVTPLLSVEEAVTRAVEARAELMNYVKTVLRHARKATENDREAGTPVQKVGFIEDGGSFPIP